MQTFNYHNLPAEFESVSNVTATNSVDLGTVRVVGGEEYVYVYNAGVQSIPVGNYAVLSANSGFSVTVSSVTGYDLPFGFVKHAAIGTGTYGWLLGRGFTKIQMVANQSSTTSDIIYPGGQGLAAVLGQATSLQCAVAFQPIGYVVSGAASASSALAYVRCYGV